MATITSSTHGPFNLGSTWVGGVAPVNGDAFIINYGHVVSVTGDQRKTNGFDDSFVRGKLHMFSGSLLRMSGILYVDNTANNGAYFVSGNSATAGFFRMDHGSVLELAGTNADQHRLEIRAQRFITCEIEGNNPNPQTVVSGNYDVNALKFSVSGLSGITRGDWISIYKSSRPSGANTGGIYLNNASDEGVWVHTTSGNDIYFRKFVSPTGTITSSTVSGVTVNDASVFRSGYAVVFGTGANLNLQQISNINYGANTIDFNSAVTGSVIGEVIYRTSFDKAHRDGDTVQKIASSLIATSNIGANTITVNSVQGFSVDDLILIPANDETNTSVDIVQDYRISGIVGNTITLKAGFTNTGQNTLASPAIIGGIVANMKRETQITAPSGTPYLINQSAGHGAFVYAPNYITDFTRKLKITNTLFSVSSNTNSTTFGNFAILGYFAYDEQSSSATKGDYTSVIEGNVIYPTNRQANSNTAQSQNLYSINVRNNISYNSLTYGFGLTAYGVGFFNNIICRNQGVGLIVNECAFANSDISYNYLIRTPIGMSYRIVYEPNHRFAHNYILYSTNRPFDFYYSHSGILFSDFYIDGFVVWPLVTNRSGSPIIVKNSYMGNRWDITTPVGSGLVYNNGLRLGLDVSTQSRTIDGTGGLIQSVNHNFKFDQFRTWGQMALRAYDPAELAWRVYPDLSSTTVSVYNVIPTQTVPAQAGFMNTIYVPAGARVFITGQVKTSSQFSANTNYPYLIARTSQDYFWGQYRTLAAIEQSSSSSTISEAAGFMTRQRFTAASATAYETITLTIPAKKFDYFLSYGIVCDNPSLLNGRNGWYEKNISASIDIPSQCADQLLLNHLTSQLPITIKQTPNQLKTILGG